MEQCHKKYIYWLCATIAVIIRQMWNLPLVSSIAFLAGTWLFFDIKEIWFLIYAAIYLALGWIAMFVRKYLIKT